MKTKETSVVVGEIDLGLFISGVGAGVSAGEEYEGLDEMPDI